MTSGIVRLKTLISLPQGALLWPYIRRKVPSKRVIPWLMGFSQPKVPHRVFGIFGFPVQRPISSMCKSNFHTMPNIRRAAIRRVVRITPPAAIGNLGFSCIVYVQTSVVPIAESYEGCCRDPPLSGLKTLTTNVPYPQVLYTCMETPLCNSTAECRLRSTQPEMTEVR